MGVFITIKLFKIHFVSNENVLLFNYSFATNVMFLAISYLTSFLKF